MPEFDNEPTARVTMTMLFKELRETKEMVIEMRSDLHQAIKQGEDHEKRIRQLEQFRWMLAGVALVVSVVVELIAKTLFK